MTKGEKLSRRALLALAAAVASVPRPALAQTDPSDPAETWLLWPRRVPGANARTRQLKLAVTERSTDPTIHDRSAAHTTDPTITVVRAARPNGGGVLLIPGGAYRQAAFDKEGLDCARVFAAAGVTCFVLRYRLPGDGWDAGPDAPLQDAQRAMRIIRANAAIFAVQPNRLAVLGASAGGHLAGTLAARSGEALYKPSDKDDAASARPDAAILLYPVVTMGALAHAGSRAQLLGPAPSPQQLAAYSLENRITTGYPPTFILHALDDPTVPVENSLNLLAALRGAKISSECHLFQEGGHGFGIRLAAGKPCAIWPQLVLNWGARCGWLA